MAEKTNQSEPEVKSLSTREIEEMTLEEIDSLSAEEIAIHLQRAELREKAMRLQQLTREHKKHQNEVEQTHHAQQDRINQERTNKANEEIRKKNCSHRKGGFGTGAVLGGRGTDGQDYCLARHQLPSGALMILCLRCGREEYSYNPLTRQPATPGFAEFSSFPTRNHTSGSCLFFPIGAAPVVPLQ